MKRSALIFLAAATTACQVAQADEISGGSPPDILIYALSDYRESYIAAIMQPLRQKTADHRTLTSDDIAWDVVKTRAARKGREMNAFFASDTNGDDVLDAAELAQPILNYELKRQNITAADTDHDGKISLQEALTFAERSTDEDNQTRDVYPLPRLLALDPDGDGKLTDRELLQLASAAFDHYDLDGDGVLSSAEKAPLNRDRAAALEAEDFRRQMAQCGLPLVEKGDKVYLITTYEGGTLSNVTVGGQDAVTETATINIAAGDDPLYITASSYEPIIWKFTGHVERVAHFYATARDGSGAFGLPGDKVTLKHDIQCIRSFKKPAADSQKYYDRLSGALHHGIEGVVYRYSAFTINLPADARGLNEPWETRYDGDPGFTLAGMPKSTGLDAFPEAVSVLGRFSPGGIADFDPARVVGSSPPERYDVLPQEAGVLQLLQNGALVRQGSKFVVTKPFSRYPAGLSGSHSITYIFPEGMKLPDGDKGASSVQIAPAKPSEAP